MLHQEPGRGGNICEGLRCNNLQKDILHLFQAIIPRLEAADYVYRYSWFITRYNEKNIQAANDSEARSNDDWYLDKVNALFVEDSTELSSVGKFYNDL